MGKQDDDHPEAELGNNRLPATLDHALLSTSYVLRFSEHSSRLFYGPSDEHAHPDDGFGPVRSVDRQGMEQQTVLPKKRIPCDQCRRRRIRCNGASPCDRCTTTGLNCSREYMPKRRGPKKGAGKVISQLESLQKGGGVGASKTHEVYSPSPSTASVSAAP